MKLGLDIARNPRQKRRRRPKRGRAPARLCDDGAVQVFRMSSRYIHEEHVPTKRLSARLLAKAAVVGGSGGRCDVCALHIRVVLQRVHLHQPGTGNAVGQSHHQN